MTYKYDNTGALAKVYDSETGTTSTYYYDFTDRMMKYVEKSSTGTHSVGYEYDNINNLTALVETINGVKRTTSYTYDEDNRTTAVNIGGSHRGYTYDTFGRVSQDETRQYGTKLFTRSYVYRDDPNAGASPQAYRQTYTGDNFSVTFGYGYNNAGNIAYTNAFGFTNTYKYDSANQLVRENSGVTGTTTIWTYDSAGNILTREVYPKCIGDPDPATRISIVNYTYGDDKGWGDLLTAYNGVPITHDEIGNPLNDGTWAYTWQHGRQLASMTKLDGSAQWSYTYNADGLRTQRKNTVTNRTYNYTYLGDQLTHMTVDNQTFYFAYDASGVPLSMTYNGVNYYYVTNLQGDVVAILNSSGTEVVHYTYDPWGNLISTTGTLTNPVGFYNPLRYRGYVYDAETELYYLQSRYYSPEMGRFINADAFASTGQGVLGNNMFAYCLNNPVMLSDPNGHAPEWWQWAISGVMVAAGIALVVTGVGGVAGGALICAGANSIIGSYVSEATGGSSVAGWAGGMITGAACGTGAGFAGNLLAQATNTTGAACLGNLAAGGVVAYSSGAVGSAIGQGVSATIDGKKLNSKEVVNASMATGAINCLSGFGAGIGTALQGMPAISTTTTTLANSLNAAWSLISESVCDFLGTIPSFMPWEAVHFTRLIL